MIGGHQCHVHYVTYKNYAKQRHTNTHICIHTKKGKKKTDYCLLPVQQNCTFNRLWAPSSYTHQTHPKFNVLHKTLHLSPESSFYPLWVLELGIK